MIDWFDLRSFRMTDFVDVAVVAVLLYVLLVALKQTRTTFVIAGVVLLVVTYLTAVVLDLRLALFLLQLVSAVAFLSVIVMFHEELRASAERFLSWRAPRRPGAGVAEADPSGTVETLISTVTDFARERVGALIVLPGRDSVTRHLRGGTALDGKVSEALLKSIFDAHSIGHDGAVLIAGDRVERFACHLPLSTDAAKIGKRGTRHAAALGLAEKTDSLCLVVSEERGTISVARHGQLETMEDLGRLSDVLGDFRREMSPQTPRRSWVGGLRRNLGLKAAAIVGAALLWFVVVHEGATEYESFLVAPTPVGQGSRIVSVLSPTHVQVVVSGPRRIFYWIEPTELTVNLPLVNRTSGTHEIFLTATDVELPDGMTFVNLVPRVVRVTIDG